MFRFLILRRRKFLKSFSKKIPIQTDFVKSFVVEKKFDKLLVCSLFVSVYERGLFVCIDFLSPSLSLSKDCRAHNTGCIQIKGRKYIWGRLTGPLTSSTIDNVNLRFRQDTSKVTMSSYLIARGDRERRPGMRRSHRLQHCVTGGPSILISVGRGAWQATMRGEESGPDVLELRRYHRLALLLSSPETQVATP